LTHEFEAEGARYGVPDPDWGLDEVADESGVRLSRIAGKAADCGMPMTSVTAGYMT
jgi:hypothetical protein